MILPFVNIVVMMMLAPLLQGIINKIKAIAAGRSGPPLLQVYYDIFKLLRKKTVVSKTTTILFFAGPVVSVATAIGAGLMLPFAGQPAVISFAGDMILFIYLFALARFFVATAAMDTGSAFEGMGAAREVTFSALAEPALLFGLLALARVSGSLTLTRILNVEQSRIWHSASASVVLIIISWFIVLLAENSRVPFDDPNTHLELTMVHEVMVLDHGGPLFGLVLYGASIKLMLFSAVIASLIVPVHSGMAAVDAIVFLCGVLVVAVSVGLVESNMARLRFIRVPQLLITATLLAAFAVVLLLR